MKKFLLLLIIPFLSFGQSADIDLLKGYNYYDEIHPGLSTFPYEIHITPDQKYLVIDGGYKPSEVAIYDFKTLELINKFDVPNWIFQLYYNDNIFYATSAINPLAITARVFSINLNSNKVYKINKKSLKRLLPSSSYGRSLKKWKCKRIISETQDKHQIKSKIGIHNDFAFNISTNSITVLNMV